MCGRPTLNSFLITLNDSISPYSLLPTPYSLLVMCVQVLDVRFFITKGRNHAVALNISCFLDFVFS